MDVYMDTNGPSSYIKAARSRSHIGEMVSKPKPVSQRS